MNEKKVIFKMPEDKFAEMRIRLRHDSLTQYQFYNWLTEKYISSDMGMVEMIEGLKLSIGKQGVKRIRKTKHLIQDGERNKSMFNLTEEDKRDLYDIIEKEIPEI